MGQACPICKSDRSVLVCKDGHDNYSWCCQTLNCGYECKMSDYEVGDYLAGRKAAEKEPEICKGCDSILTNFNAAGYCDKCYGDTMEPEEDRSHYCQKCFVEPCQCEAKQSANDIQHGGNHYKDKAIQPWDYIVSNNLGFLEGNAVKYLSRWRKKNGVEDLKKAIHYIEKLIEVETQDGNNN